LTHIRTLLKRPVHLAVTWLVVLCLIVQSLGAFAGVLCVGCESAEGWAGIALNSEPCSTTPTCCTDADRHEAGLPGALDESHPEASTDGCDCIDFELPPDGFTLGRPKSKDFDLHAQWLVAISPALVHTPALGWDAPLLKPAMSRVAATYLPTPLTRRTVLTI
jgi:hypothetical protein